MGSQTKNYHPFQSEISQDKISKLQKMEKPVTFLTLGGVAPAVLQEPVCKQP